MRVLFVNKLYPPDVGGGAEVTLASLVSGLRTRGIVARVVTTTDRPERTESCVDGVSVVRLPLRNIYWHNDARQRPMPMTLLWHGIDKHNLLMEHALRRELRLFQPDLVSFHNLAGFSAAAWDAAARLGIPSIQVLHDYYHLCARSQLQRGERTCERRCLSCRALRVGRGRASRKLSAVVGISHAALNRHLAAGLFRDVAVQTVIHNARHMQAAQPRPCAPRATVFGYLGTLGPWKGVAQLLQAFTQLRAEPGMSQLHLRIAGRGAQPYEAELRRRYSGLNCDFLGQVPPRQLLSTCDVLVVPSLWHEPLGMVTVEALMAGVPVVAAARGGIPETVRDGVNGLLYDPGQPGALLNAMRRLSQPNGLLPELAARSVASVQRFCDVDRMVSEYVTLYQRLTHQGVRENGEYAQDHV